MPTPQAVASTLTSLLEGLDYDAVLQTLQAFATEHNLSARFSKPRVWLGDEVVVKVPLTVGKVEDVPEEYRPTSYTVWTGKGPLFASLYTDGPIESVSVVVQPRYQTLPRTEWDQTPLRYVAQTVIDNHAGNWGIRPDGSPVLFDF
jgi:hypothetical protein